MVEEFERDFETISVEAVNGKPGILSEIIHKLTKRVPDEYAMVSHWASGADLEEFAGSNWHQAVIPETMVKYVKNCWVSHYASW